MDEHEIVGYVSIGDDDTISTVIKTDIINDGLLDDPIFYLTIKIRNDPAVISFPLKEVYRTIEKRILSDS